MKEQSLKEKYFFILNGPDLEMDEIIKVLKKDEINWVMPYQERGEKTIRIKDLAKYKQGQRVRVYVECFPEKRLVRKNDIYIDHHNQFMRRRGAIIQVKKLFKLEITQHDLWVEAYDRAGVYGALTINTPKKVVEDWVNDNLKRAGVHKNKAKIIQMILEAESIGDTRIVRIYKGKGKKNPKTTSILQLTDLTSYPRRQNILVILYENKKIVKYSYFADPKISHKLQKKFGGYLFGNPTLKNVSWGFNSHQNVPPENEVLRIISNQTKSNAKHKK